MKIWQRRSLALASILGAGMGFTLILSQVGEISGLVSWIIVLLFTLIFAWGAWLGVRLLEGHRGALRPLFIFWLLQVPMFATPALSYALACGLSATVSLEIPFKLAGNAAFGTSFMLMYNSPGSPYMIGINVFALVVALWLRRLARTS